MSACTYTTAEVTSIATFNVLLYGDVTPSQGAVAEQSGSLSGNAQENATTRKKSKLT